MPFEALLQLCVAMAAAFIASMPSFMLHHSWLRFWAAVSQDVHRVAGKYFRLLWIWLLTGIVHVCTNTEEKRCMWPHVHLPQHTCAGSLLSTLLYFYTVFIYISWLVPLVSARVESYSESLSLPAYCYI